MLYEEIYPFSFGFSDTYLYLCTLNNITKEKN